MKGCDMSDSERNALKERRWRLMNNFGYGSFQDGLTQQAIDRIDERLAAARRSS